MSRRQGEAHQGAKLTWEAVRQIRELAAQSDFSPKRLATEYGVSASTILDVATGEKWQDFDRAPLSPVIYRRCRRCLENSPVDVHERFDGRHRFICSACSARPRAVVDYGPSWAKQRKRARRRDGFRCQSCQALEPEDGREFPVHHLTPFFTFGYVRGENDSHLAANDLNNLVTLCPACHGRARKGD